MTDAMITAGRADDELATLAKLGADEQELRRRLEDARREAEARLIDAREAAARLKAQAEADCREELARLRQERTQRLETELATVREETTKQMAALLRCATANRRRTLDRLVADVTGSATS